jgi:hypothetical protein
MGSSEWVLTGVKVAAVALMVNVFGKVAMEVSS